jgi:hypothetical protein
MKGNTSQFPSAEGREFLDEERIMFICVHKQNCVK